MSFKPIEPKRDEFRKYLEHSGIIEALTKVFSKLIDEEHRPENPLQYIKDNLGDTVLQNDNIAHLNAELKEAQDEIQKLKDIVKSIENAESASQNIPVTCDSNEDVQ